MSGAFAGLATSLYLDLMKFRGVCLVLLISIVRTLPGFSQSHTLGILSYQPSKSFEGYNLFFPKLQGTVWLTDNCGEIIHKWPDPIYQPGEAVYLMDDGTLFAAKGRDLLSNPVIHSGGGGEKVEHRDWDNTLLWTYTYNDSTVRMHHDFTVMPNGNVLLIAWEVKDKAACISAGRDTNKLSDERLFPDHLVEVRPLGPDNGVIVWQWHAWDHLVQDFDSTKANFGVVADHPELIDLNFVQLGTYADWMHSNTVRYHPGFDQIMLSVASFSEVWIIDHSTSVAEAASHSGGKAGKGGDLLYRWGNPQAYQQGDSTDQMLGVQHTPHWLTLSTDQSDPLYGKVLLFNNRKPDDLSSVGEFTLPFDTNTWSYAIAGGRYLPTGFDWVYTTPDRAVMNSAVVSNAQLLPNGNTLICACRSGYAFEIDSTEAVVWEYKIPFYMGMPASQGTVLPLSSNLTFRLERYPPDFPAFTGKDMSPKGYIEFNPDTVFCDSVLTHISSPALPRSGVYPVPASEWIYVPAKHLPAEYRLVNTSGVVVSEGESGADGSVDVGVVPSGFYFLMVGDGEVYKVVVGR